MLMHVNLRGGGVEGRECCTNTVRESALKVDGEKTRSSHQGIERASAVCLGPMLDQLCYSSPSTFPL